MENAKKNRKWWDQWKGPVAAILGLITGTGRCAFNINAAASGIILEYKLEATCLKFAAGTAKLSASATAVGPAILLGAGVAALVYIIPWGHVLSLIQGIFSSVWNWICNLWESLSTWVQSRASESLGGSNTHTSWPGIGTNEI